MRILVADDDLMQRDRIVTFLQQQGHKVEEALSVQEVLNCCRHKCPDLSLIALQLSGVSGIDIVQQMRRMGGGAVWNPIVLMGVDPTKQQLQAGIAAGADDFFLQPINIIALEYKIKAAQRQEDLKEQVFSVAHDLVLANRALENVVNNDSLTGMADLNTFHQALEKAWFHHRAQHTSLSLIIIGLDCFKRYNAIYGAVLGDERIKEVAITLKSLLREVQNCTFARTVGESFSILLSGMPIKTAIALANKIIMAIEALKIPHADSKCSQYLTASAGVAALEQENFKNALELMEAADYALYQAKHLGRNRVYAADASELLTK